MSQFYLVTKLSLLATITAQETLYFISDPSNQNFLPPQQKIKTQIISGYHHNEMSHIINLVSSI